ncbi:MAG: type II secretion system protein N [Pseudomonadota bacterium]|nr:MAG: type II secretion system protein N [Pseudomonadota bacterium]
MKFRLPMPRRWPRFPAASVKYVVVGLVAWLVFLVATIPASIPYGYLVAGKPAQRSLALTGIQGTLWSGSAASARIGGIAVGRLEWDMRMLQLLLGRLGAHVSMQGNGLRADGDVALKLGGEMQLSDVVARVPAQALMPLFYGYPISLVGEFSANLEQFAVKQGQTFAARGRVAWQGAGVSAPQALAFGDLLLTLEPTDDGSKGVLADKGGPMQIEGLLNIAASGQYNLDARLAAREEQSPLKAALGMLGRPDAQGKVTFKRRGKLPGW